MVPAPGALGAVLAQNASDLRPLAAGALWEYRGSELQSDGSRATYNSSVRQTAGVAGAVTEASTNVLASGSTDSQTVLATGGNVLVRVTDPLGIGSTENLDMIELRSPVRVNDQYVQLERNDVDIGLDADGDRLSDRVDLAIYRTVVGEESITLAGPGRTYVAVRVDTTFLVRIKRSSDGGVLPMLKSVQSDWYVSGLGVVRRTMTEPSETVGPTTTEEVLARWEGVNTPAGLAGPALMTVASGATFGASALGRVNAVASTGDTALVSMQSTNSMPGGSIGVIDASGVVTRLQPWPFADVFPFNYRPRLHTLGVGSALLAVATGQDFGWGIRAQRMDGNGNLVGAAFSISNRADSPPSTAWDGRALWVAWVQRDDAISGARALLQAFGLDGQPLAAAQVLDSGGIAATPQVAADANGRVIVTWARIDSSNATYLYATRFGTGPAEVRTLGAAPRSTDLQLSSIGVIQPVVGGTGGMLLWYGPRFSTLDGTSPADGLPRAVAVDASGNPIRSTARLDDERLPSSWNDFVGNLVATGSADGVVFAGATVSAPNGLAVEDVRVVDVPLAGQAFATAAAAAVPQTSHRVTDGSVVNLAGVREVLPWGKRVMVFGDNAGRATVATFTLP